jgi:hypothetical protein
MKSRTTKRRGRKSLPDPSLPPFAAVRELSNAVLVAAFGASESWWERRRPELRRRGLLVKRGRYFWGRLDRIGGWLLSPEGTAATVHTNRVIRLPPRQPSRVDSEGGGDDAA